MVSHFNSLVPNFLSFQKIGSCLTSSHSHRNSILLHKNKKFHTMILYRKPTMISWARMIGKIKNNLTNCNQFKIVALQWVMLLSKAQEFETVCLPQRFIFNLWRILLQSLKQVQWKSLLGRVSGWSALDLSMSMDIKSWSWTTTTSKMYVWCVVWCPSNVLYSSPKTWWHTCSITGRAIHLCVGGRRRRNGVGRARGCTGAR